jgi:hypothetical protein
MKYKDYYTEIVSLGKHFDAPQPDFDTYSSHNENPHQKNEGGCVGCINEEVSQQLIDFANTRKGGADDISKTAKEKGGDAILTHYHFDVKLPYYEKVASGNFNVEKATAELNGHIDKLKAGVAEMEQEDFQKLVGIIEVLGELIIKQSDLNKASDKDEETKDTVSETSLKNKIQLGKVYSGNPKVFAFAQLEENKYDLQEINEYDVENYQDVKEFYSYMKTYKPPLAEAKYQGRTVKLGKPFRTSGGPKKFSVYVKNPKGNVVKVNFGDPNMKIKKNIPARRKSFRARHNCSNPGPRHKARYWSCRAW